MCSNDLLGHAQYTLFFGAMLKHLSTGKIGLLARTVIYRVYLRWLRLPQGTHVSPRVGETSVKILRALSGLFPVQAPDSTGHRGRSVTIGSSRRARSPGVVSSVGFARRRWPAAL